jgi:hypothetical protein
MGVVNIIPRPIYLRERIPLLIGWAQEPVSRFSNRQKSLSPAGIRKPDNPARIPVSITITKK